MLTKQIQRRTDHWFTAACRSRYADQGDQAQARDVAKSNDLTRKPGLTDSRKPTIFSFGTLQVIEIFAQSRQHKWVICVRKLFRQI